MRNLSTPSAIMISPLCLRTQRASSATPMNPRVQRSFWLKQATLTASNSAWIAQMIAMLTMKLSEKRPSPCWRASVSRLTSTLNRGLNTSLTFWRLADMAPRSTFLAEPPVPSITGTYWPTCTAARITKAKAEYLTWRLLQSSGRCIVR